ncbi:MAG: diguanylate cyclase [Spirochaetales bacterium]|nr:diguanylate cyclase [Spirochaetales bacterium]
MPQSRTALTDIVRLIEGAEFFSRLLQDDLYWLAAQAELCSLAADTVLFRPGEKARCFYIVRDGSVAISRLDAGGRSEEMARFVTGDVVGDFDFARGASYDAMATCATPADLLVFPGFGKSMDDLIKDKPDVSARVLLRMVAMISSRVRSTQALISNNAPWVRELRRQVYTDAATGLWSRTFLDEELSRMLESPAAIVAIKPDRFKELCDAWGHSAGDVAMEKLAAILKDEARALRKAWAIRLRSNEAAIVASSCDAAEADALAARLSEAYTRLDLSSVAGDGGFRLSASVAISSWPEDGRDLRGLVSRTHELMAQAWKDGGSRVYRLEPSSTGAGAQP